MAKELKEKLIGHLNTIHETFQLFQQTPSSSSSSVDRVIWKDVLQMSDHVAKQATIVGMLWTGQAPDKKSVADTMDAYINALQGFLLLCHGSTVGSGPTLSSAIHSSVKQIVDSSFKLLQASVSMCDGSDEKDRKSLIPQLAGVVWEACSAFKKVPSSNTTAIGRAITQVAVSVKDVLREVKELKPASSSPNDEATVKPESGSQDIMNADDEEEEEEEEEDDDLGNDLSPEEMEVAKLAVNVVSETLVAIKELIRTITGLIKLENSDEGKFVETLEKLLKLCREIGIQIDELGASLYPPQEIATMKKAIRTISGNVDQLGAEIKNFKVSSEPFVQACKNLLGSVKILDVELDRLSTVEVVSGMQNLTVCEL